MPRISVASNIGQAKAILEKWRSIGANPRPLLELAGGILEESTRARFMSGHGPGGIPWPISRRAALGGGRTLIDRGGLLSSLTHVADDHRVEVGIIAKTESAKFAYVHQFGAIIRPSRGPFLIFKGADGHTIFARQVTIPPRPIVGIDGDDRTDLLEAWQAYIAQETRQ